MHIIRIDRGDGVSLSQAVARVDWPTEARDLADGARLAAFLRLHGASVDACLAAPRLSSYLAVDLRRGARLSTTYALICRREDEPALRLAIAALTRLDGVFGASVRSPESAERFLSEFAFRDGARLALDDAALETTGGGVVRPDMSLFDALGDVIAAAAALEVGIRFECAIADLAPGAEPIRAVLHDALRLEMETAAPKELVEAQRAFGRRLGAARRHAIETITVDAGQEGFVARIVDAAERPLAARLGLRPDLVEASEEHAAALAYMTHPAVMDPTLDAESLPLALYLTQEAAADRLRATPLVRRFGVDLSDGGGATPLELLLRRPSAPAPTPSGAPAGSTGGERPYLFVSYAHLDRARVDPIVERLGRLGVAIWMDDQIAVGDEWDTRLETQILASAGVLAFVSDAYAASKYCRREAKFADVLDKPIIAVRLGDPALGEGLAFLFATLQHVASEDPELEAKLVEAVRRAAGGALSNGAAR